MLDAINILGVNITNENETDILEYVFESIRNVKNKLFIITPNPEMLVYASKHLAYKDKLNSSSIALPDGVGLFFAAGLFGKVLKERITGVDFIQDLCKASRDNPLSIGFLGGKAGVANRTAECLLQKYPYLDIVFAGSEWNEDGFKFREEYQAASSKYQEKKDRKILNTKYTRHDTKIDMLFVAFGVPKQEEWIYKNLNSLPIKAAMGVGGSFDFISGDVRRAPFLIRYAGLEWLYRLITQPWRWKRQLALIEFILLVFKQKFSTKEK